MNGMKHYYNIFTCNYILKVIQLHGILLLTINFCLQHSYIYKYLFNVCVQWSNHLLHNYKRKRFSGLL